MKSFIAILAVLVIAGAGYGQLVNPGFEEWADDAPVGWFNLNQIWHTVEASETAHSGQYAARLLVDTIFTATYISQTISVTDLGDTVEVELFYSGMAAGTQADIILLASGDTLVDGNDLTLYGPTDHYQSAKLVWTPFFDHERYDSVMIWIDLEDTTEQPFNASILLDDVTIRGMNGVVVHSETGHQLPAQMELSSIYPNPFNGGTRVTFVNPAAGQVDLAVYDIAGRRIATLAQGLFLPGSHEVGWRPANDLGAGVYIVRLKSAESSSSVRAVYLR